MTTKRAGILCRISQTDKRVPKVELQEEDCRKLAAANPYEVVAVYVDDGISASKFLDRPGWAQMLLDVQERKLDVLLATEEERFTRQVMEKEQLQLACAASGVTWHTVRGGTCDPATADGEFFSTMRGAMARMESKRKAERSRDANVHQRAAGKVRKAGGRPFGFEEDKVTVREREADLIRWATRHLINGGFMYDVHQHFNDSGIKTSFEGRQRKVHGEDRKAPCSGTWGYGSIKTLLCRARNAGIIEHEGEPVVQAEWARIVTPEELGAVRAILASTHPGKRIGKPVSLGGGICRCSVCGNTLNVGYPNKRAKLYRCSGRERTRDDGKRHPSIFCSVIDPMLKRAVVASYFTTFGQVKDLPEAQRANRLTVLYSELEQAEAGIGRIRASIAAGDFTSREYASELATLRGQAEEARRGIDAEATSSAHAGMLAESWDLLRSSIVKDHRVSFADAVKVKAELRAAFDSLSLEHQRSLVGSLLRVTVHPGTSTDRVEIEHLGAPDLDSEPYVETTDKREEVAK